ncbi:P-loop nucleotide/nucleoside kinase family protein [Amycolatopsis echigonensis]|uniref:AAA domain-containing protein n=1 Tax=Amycolatopsis echigonensis TaxID=2576905 RepID=A0A2N3WU74_9PSEU|nr:MULTISPECIES: AAA family ATPase [Amycolatopsis]MBB2503515.1 AAA family ATPase [Amycolatopsis echigonensis]PKV97395.1 AAA domain-containing protein [Amycolatopsis niigatensis]
MARLIHLNGPSGIGKSTVARRYADLHPGVLDLDADQVVMMIGGWRTAFWDTLPAARRLALAMAETHLRAGYDVVMPQLVTRLDQAEQFEEAARAADGEYVEIMLTAPRPQAKARFAARGDHAATDAMAELGGPVVLDRIHDHVGVYLALRPQCTVLDTEHLGPDETCAKVAEVVARGAASERALNGEQKGKRPSDPV